jgi:hypothetical protein
VDEGSTGVPSDHQGVLVIPLNNFCSQEKTKRTITTRPIMESSIDSFGREIVLEDWSFLNPESGSTLLVQQFQDHCSSRVDEFFPLKTVQITSYDQPFFTDRLRLIRRQRQREYRKAGKSERYTRLKAAFTEMFEKEAHKYKDKIIAEVTDGKRGSAYKALKKLGSGKCDDNSFDIPSHVEQNLSSEESAEVLAEYFSSISQEFDPIDPSSFTPDLKEKLQAPTEPVPILQEYQVYQKIVAAKKPNSSVPGDLPKKVVTSFSVELSAPVTTIYNKITTTAEYPRQWVIEHQTPIPKVSPTSSEDDLRNISGTPFFSKVYEAFLSDWLLPIVSPYLDPANCGGLKGLSISHYLIRLLHFIHRNIDKAEPHAVVMALVDLSKAFNRVDHLLVIQDLHDMKVPAWLLKILISYLTERSMVIKFRGATSSTRSLPGSSPQGVFLGCFFFMVKFNGALLRPDIQRPFSKPCPEMLAKSTATVKYIDDASQARSIDLKKCLLKLDLSGRPRPLEFFEHTGYQLDPVKNELQVDLSELKAFTDQNLMVINQKKTQIMCFNFRTSLKFPPIFYVGDSAPLEIVNETKLLGIILTDDLKWNAHVEFMCKKASKKIWQLRRMKILNLEPEILLDFYLKEVRSILEFGVACWNSGITCKLSERIERLQKICVNIILCDSEWEIPYFVGCTLLGIEPLAYRRSDLCIRFVQKASLDPRHADLFIRNTDNFYTRQEKPPYNERPYRTGRFFKSPLCYLTRLLNMYPPSKSEE